MPKTLSGTYTINGYTLPGAFQGALNPVTVTGSIDVGSGINPAALYGQGSAVWTVTNLGTITGGSVAAIELAGGGTVVNGAPGFIAGHYGVEIANLLGSVTNTGIILANNAGTTAPASVAIGVWLRSGGAVVNQANAQIVAQGWGIAIQGAAGTVTNNGAISGAAQDGVYLISGTVTNQSQGSIGGGYGIVIKTTGGVTNAGTVTGGTSGGSSGVYVSSGSVTNLSTGTISGAYGIVLAAGGSVSNAGLVTGKAGGGAFLAAGSVGNQGTMTGTWGVIVKGGTGTVTNTGVLNGTTQGGAYLTGGGITNGAGGLIEGVNGVVIKTAAGTVVNSGTIAAASASAYSVYTVPGFANRVVVNPGALFTGRVTGGNSVTSGIVSTLEFGATSLQGTLSGLGSQFFNFGAVTFDPGSSWSLTGANTLVAGTTLLNQGTVTLNGATLSDAAPSTISGTANAAAAVTVTGAGGNWSGSAPLVVGGAGDGSFLVNNQGTAGAVATATRPAVALGAGAGVNGTLRVTGQGSGFRANGELDVGQAGNGQVQVDSQGTLSTGANAAVPTQGVDVAQLAGGSGGITVTGTHSLLTNGGEFIVGDAGTGGLSIEAGGTVITSPGAVAGLAGAVIANTAGASGSFAHVTGTGSNWQVGGILDVGNTGFGQLSVSAGGAVTTGALDAGNGTGGTGAVLVVGTGSTLTVGGALTVGDHGAGSLSLLNGGQVTTTDVSIGASVGGQGNLVIGTGGVLHTTGTVHVGLGGSGVLEIQGGTLSLLNSIDFGSFGRLIQIGGLIDPPLTQDIPKNSQFGGGGRFEVGATLTNSNGVVGAPLISGGSETFLVPLLTHGTAKPTGILAIDLNGTLVLDVNVVDASQTVLFTDPTGKLVIGQQVTVDPADATHTPTLTAASALGGFAARIGGYATGNVIVVDTNNPAGFTYVPGASVIAVRDLVGGLPAGTQEGILTFTDAASAQQAFTDLAQPTPSLQDQVACFLAGTAILTDAGPRPVESLSPGDAVVTLLGGPGRIVWTGHRTIDCARHPRPETVWPVRVAAGAFGPDMPGRDLFLSPDHAVHWRGALVPVRLLVNGATIRQVPRDTVTYHHVELARHDLVLAEGLPTETYLDTGNRTMFEVGGQPLVLHPDFATGQHGRETLSCAPFAHRPDQVEPVWRALAERAEALGWSLPAPTGLIDDPDLRVLVGTRRVAPVLVRENCYTFVLPPGDGAVRLLSRTARPNDARPWVNDNRHLGVRIRRLTSRHGGTVRDLAMDDPALRQGWWDVEWDDRRSSRWTRGDALLPSLGAGVLEVELAGTMRYPVAAGAPPGREGEGAVRVPRTGSGLSRMA